MSDFKQDDEITPCLMRVMHKRYGGEVLAVFPAEPWRGEHDPTGTVSCYAHVGQHGECEPWHVIAHSRPATPEEYADLRKELEGPPYGYRLKIYKRTQRKWRQR